ncbi:hypothetical protein [Cellulomonas sp. ATA003]|uniref:hypothetical protein n=1 Tax=Cellulomonas sp. ATA003 TaxID=3073064 RepID=UPI002872E89C|nr:hypothetical protein [Cellulomonas sp. ATA003]WNB86099.1 hypothetical protein REH70_02085 [Cellulomonas sp. ATA003]
MVDVLLVEDDEDDAAADEVWSVLHELALEAMARRATWAGEPLPEDRVTVAGPPDPGPVRRIALRYRRRAVTAAVLVVAALGTTAVVEARQVAARAAALAAMPAVLADAAHAPVERWRVPGRVVGDGHDTLLVVDGASLRSVDPGTGRVVWTASAAAGRAAAGGGCFGVDEGLRPDRAPVDDGAGPRGLVACAVGGPQGAPVAGAPAREAASEAPGTSAASKSPVVVVDSATGRTRHTVTVDGELLRAEPVARDLLVTAARADGRVRVTRWDLATGTPGGMPSAPGPCSPTGSRSPSSAGPGR